MPNFLDLVNKLRQAQANKPLETVTPEPSYSSILVRPTIPKPTPPIIRSPYSDYERLVNVGRRIAADPTLDENANPIHRPGRLKSGLLQLISATGQAARNNLAAGRTGWTDVAGLGGAAAGGFGVGVADPGLIVKQLHQQALERNRQAQEEELGRITGLARAKGIEAEAARDQAYAAANTPDALQAKADAKRAIDESKSLSEALKELDDIAQKGADSDYLQARASEIESRFGKNILVPKYKAKTAGGFSLPPGGIRYDSDGNPIVQNTNPTPGQLQNIQQNADDINKANAYKRQLEANIKTAGEAANRAQQTVAALDKAKPLWDQSKAEWDVNEGAYTEAGQAYVKKYNQDLADWQKRRDKAQDDWDKAVKANQDAYSSYAGSNVPTERTLPTTPNVTPQTFSMKEIEKRAKTSGQTVEAYKARVLEIYPNARFTR